MVVLFIRKYKYMIMEVIHRYLSAYKLIDTPIFNDFIFIWNYL